MRNFNQANYQQDLNNLNLNNYLHLTTNQMTQLFHKNFMETLNKHAPLQYLSKRMSKSKQKPWLTKGILKSIKVKRQLFKLYKTTQAMGHYTKYKIYRDLLNKLCKKSNKKSL